MIDRFKKQHILELLGDYPAVAITGARQVGKTTLAHEVVAAINGNAIYLDMESPSDLARLQVPEMYFNQNADKFIVIDEMQHRPDLFPVLRSVIDRDRRNGRFLILGSASPELIRRSSESLAGRISFEELFPLHIAELADRSSIESLWYRSGLPPAFLAGSDNKAMRWLRDYLHTVTTRDLPVLGLNTDVTKLRMFLYLLAQQQGRLMNRETLARSAGVSATTISRYLYYLEHIFVIRELQPWYINMRKRLVRSPKVYIRHSGLLHAMLNIQSHDELINHLAVGGSWEGFVVEQTLALLPDHCSMYFYRTHQGAEADILIVKRNKPVVCADIKRTNAPMMSRGFANVIQDHQTEQNFIIWPGEENFPVAENVQAMGLRNWLEFLQSL